MSARRRRSAVGIGPAIGAAGLLGPYIYMLSALGPLLVRSGRGVGGASGSARLRTSAHENRVAEGRAADS